MLEIVGAANTACAACGTINVGRKPMTNEAIRYLINEARPRDIFMGGHKSSPLIITLRVRNPQSRSTPYCSLKVSD